MRRILQVLLATATSSSVAVAASAVATADAAGAGGANNIVQVRNTVDGATAARSQLSVAYDPADTVANQNIAAASSTDCNGCRTVSVAMQLVIVEGYPHTFEPANAAVASNGSCTSCQTYAFAFQYVVQPGRVVYLGADAQQQLQALRARAGEIASSNASYDEMQVELDGVMQQFVDVVNANMHNAGAPVNGTMYRAVDAH